MPNIFLFKHFFITDVLFLNLYLLFVVQSCCDDNDFFNVNVNLFESKSYVILL